MYQLYNYANELSLNGSNHVYSYTDQYPLYWTKSSGDPSKFTNPSVLFTSALQDEFGYINVDGGDSGGPLVACKDISGTDCSLIGIVEAGNGNTNIWVTTANPITIGYLLK